MLNFIFLQEAAPGGGGMQTMIFMGLLILVFYFFMIRPQVKRQKDQKKFREGVQKGDNVVTIGGVHGKILGIEGEKVVIEVDRGVKLVINKSAISMEETKVAQGTDKK